MPPSPTSGIKELEAAAFARPLKNNFRTHISAAIIQERLLFESVHYWREFGKCFYQLFQRTDTTTLWELSENVFITKFVCTQESKSLCQMNKDFKGNFVFISELYLKFSFMLKANLGCFLFISICWALIRHYKCF